MVTPSITLSIVSHGHGPLLAALLGDLERHSGPVPWKIVLTLNLACEPFRLEDWPRLDITVLRNETPRGFGANHNAAFKHCDTPWFAVLNPDLRLPENPFPRLLERADTTPGLGAIAPRIVDSSGRTEDSVRENLTPWSLVQRKLDPNSGRVEFDGAHTRFFWIAGMFMLFPASAYRAVGGFDERFFLYCEDYDLCARLSRAGFALIVELGVQSVHDAQRDSHKSRRHQQWHLTSLFKVWTSAAFWWITLRGRTTGLRRIALAVLLLVTLALAGEPALRWVDIHWGGEFMKDTWGRVRYGEDWKTLPPLRATLDYRWLDEAARPVLIAHALGDSGQGHQNSLAALDRAAASGLRLFEIDVWLDGTGRLRCHHGPDAPAPWVTGECTLADALHAAARYQAWLVLDIKTNFAETGAAVVREFAHDPAATQLIFQLYRPADVTLFSAWASEVSLPGPIITAYRARRSLRHIAGEAARLGIRAFTLPLYRIAAIDRSVTPVTLLVHPIHDCEAVLEAQALPADGYYLRTDLLPELRDGCPTAALKAHSP